MIRDIIFKQSSKKFSRRASPEYIFLRIRFGQILSLLGPRTGGGEAEKE